MKLCVILPTTGDFREIIEENKRYLARYLRPDTTISFTTIARGFPSIESDLQGTFNAAEIILKAAQAQRDGFDGVFVHCFDDPGVYACRESLTIPVFGGYQPAILTAMALAERTAVITTDTAGILSEERKARTAGFERRIVSVAKVDLGVLDLRKDKTALLKKLTDACIALWENDRVGAVCLGCTAMYFLIDELRAQLSEAGCPITVIEPLANGVCYLEHMVHLGYRNALHCGIALENLTWN